ncbi:MAG: hypothetical protein NVSMB55_18810 [Mycobacteriales bacterium]
MRIRSHSLRRGVACLALICGSTALGVPTAGADAARTVMIKPEQANWFWAEQTSGRENPVTHTGTPALDPASSGVPRGDLGVSNAKGFSPEGPYDGPDKEPLIAWDLSAYYNVTVTAFKATFFIDRSAQNLPPNAAPKLEACVAKKDWGNGAGEDIQAKPKLDCTSPIAAKYDEKTRGYSLDLTALAQTWANGEFNYGISLRSPAGEPEYQIALQRKDATGLNKIPTVFSFTPKTPVAGAPTGLGTGATTPTSGTGSLGLSGGTLAPPVSSAGSASSGSFGSVSAPSLAGPLPAPPPAAAVVAPQTAPVAAAPRALRPLAVSTRPSGAFWLGGLLLAGLLGLASLVLGAGAAGASSTTRREGGVNRALRTRGSQGLRLTAPPPARMI